MQTWHRVGDVDWVQGEGLAPRASGAESQVVAGLVIGRGYAHQTVATLGASDALAFLLRRDLSRPLETASGIAEVEVRAGVGLLETTISILGGPGAVSGALERLVQVLEDPDRLEIPPDGLPAGEEHAWAGWHKELGAWFGWGAANLSAQSNPAWTGGPGPLREAAAQASPARCPVVGFVSDERLLLELPAGGGSDAPRLLEWRDAGGHAVGATFENNLLTARAGLGAAGMAALDLLATTVHRSVVTMTGAASDLSITAYPVSGHRLVTVRALATPGTYDRTRARAALGEALAAYPRLSDDTVLASLEGLRSRATQPPRPAGLALARLLTGERTDDALRMAEGEALTVDEVRAATHELMDGILVGQVGSEPDPDYPLLTPDPVPDNGGAAQTFRTRVPILDETRGDTHLEFTATPGRLVMTTTPLTWVNRLFPDVPRRRGEPLPPRTDPVAPSTLDLTRLTARFDQGEGYSSLVDEEGRVVGVPWNALRRPEPLRELVDAATAPEDHLVLPPHVEGDDLVTRRLRTRRWSVAVFALVLVFFATMPFWPDSRGPQQEQTVTTVGMGEQVALANGTTITVSDASWRTEDAFPHPTLIATVEVCGGGPTVQRGADDDERNRVDVSDLDIGGVEAVTRRGMRPSGTYYEGAELDEGQCTSGLVSIETEVETPPEEGTVRFANSLGDEVQWELPPAE